MYLLYDIHYTLHFILECQYYLKYMYPIGILQLKYY